jgi:hypothetical protein
MSALVKVILDRSGVGELLASEGVESMLLGRAEDAAQRARQAAPVESGNYRDSIEARVVEGRTRRAAAEVAATVPYALAVEASNRTLGSSL